MRRAVTLFLSMILLSALPGFAQSTVKIRGVVLDRHSGLPLPEAAVRVAGTSYTTVTDHSGRFQFENLLAGEYRLEVHLIGYTADRQIAVRVDHDLTVERSIYLQPRIIEIQGLDIHAARLDDRIASAQRLTRIEIERTLSRDLGELLQQVNGLEVEISAAAKTVRLRGSQSNQVLILLDGVPLNDPLTGSCDLSTVPLAALQQIRIHKGGGATLHGSGALGGVIELETRRPKNSELQLHANLSAFSGSGLSASMAGQKRHLYGQISLEHQYTLGDYAYRYLRSGAWQNEIRTNADSRQDQIYTRLGWAAAPVDLSLSAQWLQSERGLPGQIHAWTPHGRAANDRLLIQAAAQRLRTHSGWHTSLSFQDAGTEYRNQPLADDPLRYRVVPAYWTENQLSSARVAAECWRQPLRSLRIAAGAEMNRTKYSDRDRLSANAPVGAADTKSAAFYIRHESELRWSKAGGIRLQSGLRGDWAESHHRAAVRHDRQWNPFLSAALHQHAGIDWQLHGAWSRAFRLPTYADLFYQQYRVVGNPQLRPERSRNREMGLSAIWRLHGEASLRLTWFSNRVEDLIIWRMGAFAAFSPVNTPAHLGGTEFEALWQSPGQLLRCTFSHDAFSSRNLSAEHTVHGKELPYRPRSISKFTLLLTPGALLLEYAARRSGSRFVTEANTVQLPGYLVHDVTLGVQINRGGYQHTLKASLFNITNQRHEMIENAPLPGREWRLRWQLTKG